MVIYRGVYWGLFGSFSLQVEDPAEVLACRDCQPAIRREALHGLVGQVDAQGFLPVDLHWRFHAACECGVVDSHAELVSLEEWVLELYGRRLR